MEKSTEQKVILIIFFFLYGMFLISYGVYYIPIKNIDFPSFYWASILCFKLHSSPYGLDAMSKFSSLMNQDVYPFVHPPQALILFYPFSLVPYKTAKILLLFLNHLAILPILYILIFKIIELPHKENSTLYFLFFVIYFFCFFPLSNTLEFGQINILVLLCLCLTWYGMIKKTSHFLIAIPLTLAIILKMYPAVFLLLLFIKKQYRSILWTFFFLILSSVLSYLVIPFSAWHDWLYEILPSSGYGKLFFGLYPPGIPANQSINAFIGRLFTGDQYHSIRPLLSSPIPPIIITYAVVISIVVVTALFSKNISDTHKNQYLNIEFSLFSLMMFLIAPISWENHLVLALPCILVGIPLFTEHWESHWLKNIIFFLAAFTLAWELPIYALFLRKGILVLLMSLKLYAVVTIWILLLMALYHIPKELENKC